ncbi:unnamed protein product [Rhodiola kirilowii]
MPRKALKQKKQIQISDDEAPVRRKFNRQAQNEARQLRALNRNFAAMAMNNNLLDGRVEDGQQPRVQQPVRRTLGDYTTPRVTGFQSAIAPSGIEANTWDKTAHFRNKIISFRSIDGETLYDAWERYKELTRMCPHHNLEQWQIIDTFYQGIDQGMRTLINQAAGGGLNQVPLEDTYEIIERAAQDYHLWTSDRGNPRDRKGVQDLCQAESTNDIARLADSMKILATEMQNMKLANSMKSSDVAHVGVYCQICGSPSHYADSCPVIGTDDKNGNQEDANYAGQNNQGAGPSYGPPTNMWDNPNRNNPNLSYKPQNPAPTGFPYKQQQGNAPYQSRGQYNPQQPKQQETGGSSSLEAMMASFMAEADKRAQEADRRAQEQDRRVKELEQTIRMIGNQVAQQADSAHREPGKLPSKPEHNSRESVNAITLRGGKQLEMIPAPATRNSAEESALNSALDKEETSNEAENREENSAQTVEPAPYKPPVPYPQ